ncbi:malate synthase A [Ornithinibacillus halotolerans]|uniref:Malate synthase n=1 Tax=Ornithinibacillus halotolerans TaxID=1274357 RepID=A0A916S1L7_9BACI|nr:malate synthase A [Ornithinibacillus halotolerans]GGA77053.1 malate synthase [Ornithinibacillus halotolerans]
MKTTDLVSCKRNISNQEYILTDGALEFLVKLHQKFNGRRLTLLKDRKSFQTRINEGHTLSFLEETSDIRNSDWKIAPLPDDLMDRRVEITGPVDRKMIINALNSGANVFMADFEDASSPTWENMVNGQLNLRDAVRKQIDFLSSNGKEYKLNPETAVLVVRPRGWHLEEKNIYVQNEAMSASLFDFGLYFYHNARQLMENGTGPYFYLPKIEHYKEARLWNDVFIFAQESLGIPIGTIKATVLIETITAAFEMDEILYELKEHSAGLNCGRWDYIFSFIKKFHNRMDVIFPDRHLVTMESSFMRAYSRLAIETCHKRNAPAIGGMAAQIPVKNDVSANESAFNKVRADKEREARDGHDGTWVAHPGMVALVRDVFNKEMPTRNQINKKLDYKITSKDLLEIPPGEITEAGLRTNISVGIEYITAWLNGRGAVPINNLMEDAATAEISRAQVWQWIRHPKGKLTDGRNITMDFVNTVIDEELDRLLTKYDFHFKDKFIRAKEIFSKLVYNEEFVDFLTLPAYEELVKEGNRDAE